MATGCFILVKAREMAGFYEREEFLVHDGVLRGGEVILWGAEGDEVFGGGVADALERGGAFVGGVGGDVELGGPEDEVLRCGVVKDGGGRPEHPGGGVFDAGWYVVLGGMEGRGMKGRGMEGGGEGVGERSGAYTGRLGPVQSTRLVDFQITRLRLPLRVTRSHEKPGAVTSRSGEVCQNPGCANAVCAQCC